MTEGVYIIEHELGPVKIGRSSNPKRRVKSLQTGCPFELELIGFVETGDATEIESNLHERYSHRHMRGEWYRLSDSELSSLRALCDLGPQGVRRRYYYSEAERIRINSMEAALR